MNEALGFVNQKVGKTHTYVIIIYEIFPQIGKKINIVCRRVCLKFFGL